MMKLYQFSVFIFLFIPMQIDASETIEDTTTQDVKTQEIETADINYQKDDVDNSHDLDEPDEPDEPDDGFSPKSSTGGGNPCPKCPTMQ